jgi:hypothetical protein
LTAQTQDSPDLVQTESKRLRPANEAHLAKCRLIINAIPACHPQWLWEEPAPLVKPDRIGFHSRKLRQPANEKRLRAHRFKSAAWARLILPSNMISPSTKTAGIALMPYCFASAPRRSTTSHPQDAADSLTTFSVSSQGGHPAVKISIFRFAIFLPPFFAFRFHFVVQQHLSSVLPVYWQSSLLPLWTQQHLLETLPVRPHRYFGEAAKATDPSAIAARSGANLNSLIILITWLS